MESDSDEAGGVTKAKRARSDQGQHGERSSAEGKGWAERKKLKKLRKEQKLLGQLDRRKIKGASSGEEEKGDEEGTSGKKKKRKKKREEETEKVETVIGDKEGKGGENGKEKGRQYTVSVAVAGSIIDNAQSPPLKAYLAGQVARAAAIFQVDEVIVYDDTGGHGTQGCEQMARVLQFLECPQYLRKDLFPIHPDLQYAGLIAPLDIPHHLRRDEALPFREGIVSKKPHKDGKDYSLVNVGLDRDCRVAKKLPPGVRVTIKFEDATPSYILKPKGKLKGTAVSPHAPRREAGLYWGYTVRLASCLEKVFSECPFREGYDLKLGTSEKGTDSKLLKKARSFNHLLIVFGGVEGLEYALENDESLMESEVSALFDHYVNTCPAQGSRTIRTEEAILISMTALSHFIQSQ